MILGLDGDGVTMNLVSAFRTRALVEYEIHIPWGWEPRCWDIHKDPTPAANGMTPEMCDHILRSEEFAKSIRPYHTAPGHVKELVDMGHEIVFVTAPMAESFSWTYWRTKVIRECFGNFDIRFMDDKSQAPVDLLVDDKPEHVRAFVAMGKQAYLINRPWNYGQEVPCDRGTMAKLVNDLRFGKYE